MAIAVVRHIPGVKDVKYRAPRKTVDSDGKVKYDSPQGQSRSGELALAVGLAAVTFATRSSGRVRKEMDIVKKMWAQKTTIRSLREMAEQGRALPDTCLVAGWIKAEGAAVMPFTPRVPTLQPLLGQINQPNNYFIDIYDKVKAARDSKEGGDAEGYRKLVADLAEKGLNIDDIPEVEDDFSNRASSAACREGLVVSELLVTRLGCEASKKTEKDKNGKETVMIEREPRAARFNVHHRRQTAEGLHLTGLQGEHASLELPEYDLASGESPSLFLTLPDPMREFKTYLARLMPGVRILNANKPFTHLSKFIFFDQMSKTDDGNVFPAGQRQGLVSSGSAAASGSSALTVPADQLVERGGALDAIGAMSPKDWSWNPDGFYDNRPGQWSRWNQPEMITYQELRARIPEAAELNSQHQDATELSVQGMRQARDEENCFRIVELGIPAGSEVVVLASPKYQDGAARPIRLVPPMVGDTFDPRFFFRILQGHTIENLVKHRKASLQVYFGFGVMGMVTVSCGLALIRDSLEVTYT